MGKHQETLPRLVEICTSIHRECAVVLIGSVARGVEIATSDIDLNILFPGDESVIGNHSYIAADNRWQLQVKDEIEGLRIDVAWETERALLERVSGDGAASCWPFSQGRVLCDPSGIVARPLKIAQAWFAAHPEVTARYEAEYTTAKAEQRRSR